MSKGDAVCLLRGVLAGRSRLHILDVHSAFSGGSNVILGVQVQGRGALPVRARHYTVGKKAGGHDVGHVASLLQQAIMQLVTATSSSLS